MRRGVRIEHFNDMARLKRDRFESQSVLARQVGNGRILYVVECQYRAKGLPRCLPSQGQRSTHACVNQQQVTYYLHMSCMIHVPDASIKRTMEIRIELYVFGELHIGVYASFSTKSL